jgi:hypothetical protein
VISSFVVVAGDVTFIVFWSLNSAGGVGLFVATTVWWLGFGLGLAPLPWSVASGLFDNEMRASAQSLVTLLNWVFSFLTIFAFPWIENGMGLVGACIVFGVVAAASFVFGLIYVRSAPPRDDAYSPVVDPPLSSSV